MVANGHGKKEADRAREASRQLFGAGEAVYSGSVPTYSISRKELEEGVPAYLLFEKAALTATRGEARRLISQGGGYINGERIEAFDQIINSGNLENGSLILRAGKKRYLRLTLS